MSSHRSCRPSRTQLTAQLPLTPLGPFLLPHYHAVIQSLNCRACRYNTASRPKRTLVTQGLARRQARRRTNARLAHVLCPVHSPHSTADSYGRGAGYAWQFGDWFNLDGAFERCNRNHTQGCEQWGLVVYPKCARGYHNVGCCICSPNW